MFTGIAAHVAFGANLAENKTVSGEGHAGVGDAISRCSAAPALGRLLGPDDDSRIGESRVVVLSHDYWQTAFGADPALVGILIIVNGQSLTIVGVAPRGFAGTTLGMRPQVFVPITLFARCALAPTNRFRAGPHGLLGLPLRPPQAGHLDRPGASGDQRPYHAIMSNVEAPLQEGMSDATMAKFKAKHHSRARRPRPELVHQRRRRRCCCSRSRRSCC